MTYNKEPMGKQALAQFRKIDYLRGLNGHCEFNSSNTLRNSVKMAINLDSNYPRFRNEYKGWYFANTTCNISSFNKKVSNISFSLILNFEFYRIPIVQTSQKKKICLMADHCLRWNYVGTKTNATSMTSNAIQNLSKSILRSLVPSETASIAIEEHVIFRKVFMFLIMLLIRAMLISWTLMSNKPKEDGQGFRRARQSNLLSGKKKPGNHQCSQDLHLMNKPIRLSSQKGLMEWVLGLILSVLSVI